MRYQESQQNEKNTLNIIVAVVNFILVIVIAICFNYLYIDFLFR